jgi:hypothetical protein
LCDSVTESQAAIAHVTILYVQAFSSGMLGVLNDDVVDVTGRPPVSFAEFAVGAAAWSR